MEDNDPSEWAQETVWCEEGGVRLVVESSAGKVTLTIESPIGLNTVTIARYRWDRLVRVAALRGMKDKPISVSGA